MPSRRIEDLLPELQQPCRDFLKALRERGLDPTLTSTRRTQEEQDNIFASGRTRPGPILTKTRKSKHILGKAFDIVLRDALGRPVWNGGKELYALAGKIGQDEFNFRWGGDWDHDPTTEDGWDVYHFEIA